MDLCHSAFSWQTSLPSEVARAALFLGQERRSKPRVQPKDGFLRPGDHRQCLGIRQCRKLMSLAKLIANDFDALLFLFRKLKDYSFGNNIATK